MATKDSLHTCWTVLSQGERLPVMLDEHGMPCFFPTLFITTQVRNSAKAATTISAYIAAIKRLYAWASRNAIALEPRLSARSYLTDFEIESLCSSLGQRLKPLPQRAFVMTQRRQPSRSRSNVAPKQISSKHRNLSCVATYVGWLAARLIERAAGRVDAEARSDIAAMGLSR